MDSNLKILKKIKKKKLLDILTVRLLLHTEIKLCCPFVTTCPIAGFSAKLNCKTVIRNKQFMKQ